MLTLAFYALTGLLVVAGILLTSKEAGWPSDAERRNVLLRSIRSSIGATSALIGLGLLFEYRTSPGSFFETLTFIAIGRAFVLIIVPLLLVLLLGLIIQYSMWQKTESVMIDKLRRTIKSKAPPEGTNKRQ